MEKIRFGFAGFRHGHIEGLYSLLRQRDDVAVVAAWEKDEEARRGAEGRGIRFTHDSLEALLSDPAVDVVAIGDYYAARGSIALRALRAGKHVLADKPLCVNAEELEQIRAEAEARSLTVGIMLDLRTVPNVSIALKAAKEGVVGKINNVIFEGQHPLMYGSRPGWYFEEGKHGGVINDIAIHGIDLARLLTGEELETVNAARCWNFYAKQAPSFADSAQFMLTLTGGAGILGDVSYSAPDSQGYTHPAYWHFRVWGEKGLMEWSMNSDGVTVCLNGETAPRRLADEASGEIWLEPFLRAVRGETDRAAFTADMLRSQEATLRVQAAAN